MLSSVEKNPFSTSPGSCQAPAVAAPRRGHSRTPSAPPTFTPSQLRELAELRCLPAASSKRGPHVSLVTVIVKGGVQTDQQNRICALRPASSAADAGLRISDVIVSVDGGPLSRPLNVLLAEGEELTIELKRSMALMGGMPAPPPPSMPDSPPSLLHAASAAAGEATSDTDSLASQVAAAPARDEEDEFWKTSSDTVADAVQGEDASEAAALRLERTLVQAHSRASRRNRHRKRGPRSSRTTASKLPSSVTP